MLESRASFGAVAQLGERRVRNAKVEGSIPFRSTTRIAQIQALLRFAGFLALSALCNICPTRSAP